MGTNKAKVIFQGQPLIVRILDRLAPLSAQCLIISNSDDLHYSELAPIPIYPDVVPDLGPLGGLYSALIHAKTDLVAMIACDLPFASPNLINLQLETIKNDRSDVVIPKGENGFEPLHALYRRSSCLPAVERALSENNRRVISWFSHVKISVLGEEKLRLVEPDLRMFLNINTIQELNDSQSLVG